MAYQTTGADVQATDRAPRRAWPTSDVVFLVVLIVAAVLGLGLRAWVLGRQPATSDDAVVGLMAKNILHGHFTAFYWGQNYGGVEPYVMSLVFLVFKQSSFAMALAPNLLNVLASVVVWRLGRRIFSARVGMAAGVLTLAWPLVDLWNAENTSFRETTLLLGVLILLFADRVGRPDRAGQRPSVRDWVMLGVLTGLGWWSSPEIMFFVVPAAVAILVGLLRRQHRLSVAASVGFVVALVVGALPWLWANVRSHFASLHPPHVPGETPIHHLHVFVTHVFPLSLGLQLPVTGSWLISAPLDVAVEIAVVALVALYCVLLLRRGRAVSLVVYVAAFPFIYAVEPLTSGWQNGRYGLYLSPVLAILLAAGADALAGPKVAALARARVRIGLRAMRTAVLSALIVVASLLTIDGARHFNPYASGPQGPLVTLAADTWHTDANSAYASLGRSIARLGVHYVVASYWVSYIMDFADGGNPLATDLLTDRYHPYAVRLIAAKRVGWLFYLPPGQTPTEVAPAQLEPGCISGFSCIFPDDLEKWLKAYAVAYDTFRLGSFVLVVPHQRVPLVTLYEDNGVPVSVH